MVGSRCSTATTAASTKLSNSSRICFSREVFSKATAAWLVSDSTRSSSTDVNGITCSSTSAVGQSTASRSRFLLISWTTPITVSWWSRIGITSIDFVRYPDTSSKERLMVKDVPAGG